MTSTSGGLMPSGEGRRTRVAGVDAARGVALVGMMSVHIFPAVTADGSVHPAFLVAAGRASALFAVLAGVALALSTGGARPLSRADLGPRWAGLAARGCLLVVLGLLLGSVPSPPVVILAQYGLLFVLAAPFLRLGFRGLLTSAAAWIVVAPPVAALLRGVVGDRVTDDLSLGLLNRPVDLFVELLLTGFYPVLVWLAYLLVGMAVGRLVPFGAASGGRLLGVGLVLAASAPLASRLAVSASGGTGRLQATLPFASPYAGQPLEVTLSAGLSGWPPSGDLAWQLIDAPHSGTWFDLVGTAGSALAVLGAAVLVTTVWPAALRPLCRLGAMTLTLYALHVLALGWGLSLVAPALDVWVTHVLFAVAAGWLAWAAGSRGPLEMLAAAVDRRARAAVPTRLPTA